MAIRYFRGRSSPSSRPWISSIVVALIVFVSTLPIYLFPITDLPVPSGAYQVGTMGFEVQDESRLGVFDADEDTPRRLLVRVWYPANPAQSSQPRNYLTEEETEHLIVDLGEMVGVPRLFQYFIHVGTHSFEDAPLVENIGPLPVVIYSHGLGSFAGQNTALMEELASHGFAVYSLQHPYTSAATIFPNGDVVPRSTDFEAPTEDSDPQFTDAHIKSFTGQTIGERFEGRVELRSKTGGFDGRTNAAARVWEQDRIFLLDRLQAGAVPENALSVVSASDFSRTGEMGMSFGGSATGGICMTDHRCAAAVNLDGGDFSEAAWLSNIPVPFLMLESDHTEIYELFGIDATNVPRRSYNEFFLRTPRACGFTSRCISNND